MNPDLTLMNSIMKLLRREYTEKRLVSVGQRAAAMLQEKDEDGNKRSSRFHPDVKKSLQKIRRFWNVGLHSEKYFEKQRNQYNNIADLIGLESL